MTTVVIYDDAEVRVEQDQDATGRILSQRTIDKLGLLANESTLRDQSITAMANMDTIITSVQAGSPTAAQLRQYLGWLAQTQKAVIRLLVDRLEATT